MTIPKKLLQIVSTITLLSLLSLDTASAKIVKVAGYNFPPFVAKDGKTGLVSDLIKKLNQSQSEYKFVFNITSPNRRYRDLQVNKVDAIFFEDEAWGWTQKNIKYQKTGILLSGGEVYVALNKDGRAQQFFDSFENKKVRGIFGYHYNFVNMQTDPAVLRKQGVSLGQTNEENLKDLLAERVDIIVINSFMVDSLLKQNPDLAAKLLISEKMDQKYQLRILLNEKSPISATDLEKMVSPNLQ